MDRVIGKAFAGRSEVIARHGMVACCQPLAAGVGLDVLKHGGNAVDAAIATNAALGLMEPMSCGIGGDLFAILWDARSKKLHGLNASGRSPRGLSYERMKAELDKLGRKMLPPRGMLTITVPGAVDGWFELHRKFGKLPMAKVLEGAIAYGKEGFAVTEVIALDWHHSIPPAEERLGDFDKVYMPGGRAPTKGEIFRNPALARTYRLLAEEGREAFYQGEIAERMDRFFTEAGGFLRKVDFAKHRSQWTDPVGSSYRGYDVFELPPNGQGIAVLQMLNILEGFDLRGMGWGSAEALHVMMEAKKLAYEDRARFYADPDYVPSRVGSLIDKGYAEERRKRIDLKRAAKQYDPGSPVLDQGDTTYLTTADGEGNMVSLIQSNYRGLGSGVVAPETGFVFQNRGQMFAMQEGHANVYVPGKRPFHTIIPGFVMKDGRPWMSFGVMGGPMQPQGHVQVLSNILDFGMNLQEAGDAPRWQHCGSSSPDGPVMKDGGYVEVETEWAWESLRELRDRGHDVRIGYGGFGGYQAIMRDEKGVYYGASESRKDGQAVGY